MARGLDERGWATTPPLLNAADPLARLAELYAVRDPLYREVATTIIESSRDEIARFSRELEAALPDPLGA